MLVDFSDNVTFLCAAQGGPGNTYQWLLNDALLQNETTDTLNLTSISLRDAGVYTCIVSNNAGMDNATATLYIRPRITTSPQDVRTDVNVTVSFTCEAEGFPTPAISWEYLGSGEPGSGSGSQPAGGSTSAGSGQSSASGSVSSELIFSPVAYSDYGVYRCVATSTALMMDLSAESDTAILTGKLSPPSSF